VVLFGAGASFGCGPHVRPCAPPLGGDLFADLARRYPAGWGALSADIRDEFEDDFERGMLVLVEKHGHSVGPLMRMMTEYFATFALDDTGADLYSLLLRGLGRDLGHILFSSLNYECLFELAASGLGFQNAYNDDVPLPAGAVRLWKLHGSCNFIPDPSSIAVAGEGVSYDFTGVQFNPTIIPVSPKEAIAHVRQSGLYAAMCLYTVHKPIQIAAGLIEGFQHEWAATVRRAAQVVVIGTRPHDEDRHLWEPLAETRAELYFVGSEDSFNDWVSRSGRAAAKSHFVAERFEEAVAEISRLLR
jgi:hypothetical protein